MFQALSPKPQLRLDFHFVVKSNYAIYNIKMSIPLSCSDQGPLENECESQGPWQECGWIGPYVQNADKTSQLAWLLSYHQSISTSIW
jgi:hypothetical protein